MKFVINAYNLKVAGGLNVALNFLKQLKAYPDDHFYVFAPENCGYEDYNSENITIRIVPQVLTKYVNRVYLDFIWFPTRIKEIKPDVLFSMGNFPLPIKIKQGLLFHYPYLIYPYSKSFKFGVIGKIVLAFQYLVFRRRTKYASLIFPQTTVAGNRLRKYYSENLNIFPVPNAYTKLEKTSAVDYQPLFLKNETNIYLVCLTKYYTHKNIEHFLDLGLLLKERRSNIRIVTTINADQHVFAKKFLDNLSTLELTDYIINIGSVNIYDVPHLYNMSDGLILPTLLESFTATYVDAMHFGKPIFTTQIDFAIEICGDAAFYFDPYSAEDSFNVITNAFKDESIINEKVEIGKTRVAAFPDWEEVTKLYISKLKELVN